MVFDTHAFSGEIASETLFLQPAFLRLIAFSFFVDGHCDSHIRTFCSAREVSRACAASRARAAGDIPLAPAAHVGFDSLALCSFQACPGRLHQRRFFCSPLFSGSLPFLVFLIGIVILTGSAIS